MNILKKLIADESAASAAEYALILAVIGSGIAAAAFGLGTAIANSMESAGTCLTTPSEANC